MSEREQLREALGRCIPESVVTWPAPYDRRYGVLDDGDKWGIVDAVLAVLDQQGWPQDCPTVEATEPSPLGSAPLLGTPQAEWVKGIRSDAYAGFGMNPAITLRLCDIALVALREAARYEPIHWLRGNTLLHYGGPNAVLEREGWVPLYRRVTTEEAPTPLSEAIWLIDNDGGD